MNNDDKKQFAILMTGIAEMYAKPMGKPQLQMYFMALSDLTIEQVTESLNKHVRDPDSGQFMPKPADVIRHVTGTSKQKESEIEFKAQAAWLSIPKAISGCGVYGTPKFKDPITTACVSVMGWKQLCAMTDKDAVWKQKEFVEHYQSFSNKPFDQLPNNIQGLEGVKQLSGFSTILTQLDNLKVEK
jgi:hypothetical protein